MMLLARLLPAFLLSIYFGDNQVQTTEELVPISIQFDNRAGADDLVLDNGTYMNAVGESFRITHLQYFVSNIQLRNTNGTIYSVPQDSSYFLVRENEPASRVLKVNIPKGSYDQLIFVLGVDSVRNTLPIGKRRGVLDPGASMDNGMYWGWNSGYIFFKMEGTSTAAPTDPSGQQKFRFHIGGFGGYKAPTINNIKMVTLDLGKDGVLKADKGSKNTIQVIADVLKTFNGNNNLSIAAHPSVMFSEYSVNVANNYCKMFSHGRTDN